MLMVSRSSAHLLAEVFQDDGDDVMRAVAAQLRERGGFPLHAVDTFRAAMTEGGSSPLVRAIVEGRWADLRALADVMQQVERSAPA